MRGAPTSALLLILTAGVVGCRPASSALARPEPACPRDAEVDASGRCRCAPGRLLLLGGCLDPATADAYCGPAAHAEESPGRAASCAFRTCRPSEALDVEGTCSPIAELVRAGPRCEGGGLVVEGGRTACVLADAACPRGTRFESGACIPPPACPPGSLDEPGQSPGAPGSRCRPVVAKTGPHAPVVDLGAWALRVLGASGGAGSRELCGPLSSRPGAFGLAPGPSLELDLAIDLAVPDQDLSRVFASVRTTVRHPPGTSGPTSAPPALSAVRERALAVSPAAQALAVHAVSGLLTALRALGGQASAAAVAVEVRCELRSL